MDSNENFYYSNDGNIKEKSEVIDNEYIEYLEMKNIEFQNIIKQNYELIKEYAGDDANNDIQYNHEDYDIVYNNNT